MTDGFSVCTNRWPRAPQHTSCKCRWFSLVNNSYRAKNETKTTTEEKASKGKNVSSVPLQININPGMFASSHLFKRIVDCFFTPPNPHPSLRCARLKNKERSVIGSVPAVIPRNDSQHHQSGLVSRRPFFVLFFFSAERRFTFRTETLQMSASHICAAVWRSGAVASPFISRLSCHPSVCFLQTWLKMNLIPGSIRPSASLCSAVIFHLYAKMTGGPFYLFFYFTPLHRPISLIARQSAWGELNICVQSLDARHWRTRPRLWRDAYFLQKKEGKTESKTVSNHFTWVNTLQCCEALCLSYVDAYVFISSMLI